MGVAGQIAQGGEFAKDGHRAGGPQHLFELLQRSNLLRFQERAEWSGINRVSHVV